MERTSVLILGHGSRRGRANAEFEALVAAYRRRHPSRDVGHAYIELAEPLLEPALRHAAGRGGRVVVLPLFLFAAGHVKDDLPEAVAAVARHHPHARIAAAGALGVDAVMVELAAARVAAALPAGAAPGETSLLAVGRGASDAEANGDFCKLVRLVGERGGFERAEPSFIAITGPRFEPAAERLVASGARRIAVLPYFLFAGRLVEQLAAAVAALRARHPGVEVFLAGHLGPDERLLGVLDRRLDEVTSGAVRPPCLACPRRSAA